MGVYIFGTLMSIILYMFIDKISKTKDMLFLKIFISILPLTIISAIRYDVGWDYLKIYKDGFYYIAGGWDYFSEKLFVIINKIVYYFTDNSDWLFITCAVIVSIFISKGIKDQSKNIIMSIFLIVLTRYFFLTMNIVRQGIAMAIILYSIKFIKDKQFMKYLFWILVASGIHSISLVFIPFYFIGNVDMFKGKNKILIILIPAFIIFGYEILVNILSGTKYINYFGSQFDREKTVISEVLISLVILFFAILNYKKNKEDKYFLIYFNMQLITVLVSVFSKFIPVSDRIIWFFSAQNIFFIPYIINAAKTREEKILYQLIIFGVLIVVFIMQTVIGDSYSVLPYNTIFNK